MSILTNLSISAVLFYKIYETGLIQNYFLLVYLIAVLQCVLLNSIGR